MKTKTGVIYTTDKLDMFRKMDGNRGVSKTRISKLVNSISKHGYIGSPIVVNEKFEVADGQARLAACQLLNVPIEYTVKEGLTIEECRALNQFMQNWTTKDFILSFAEEGNENYKRIVCYTKTGLQIHAYMFANMLFGGTGYAINVIQSGEAIVSDETFEKTLNALSFLKGLRPYTRKVKGRMADFEKVILFAYYLEDTDKERIVECLEKYVDTITSVGDFKDALSKFEGIYNRNLKKGRVYLSTEWDKYKRAK
jgi:hypothetical protein